MIKNSEMMKTIFKIFMAAMCSAAFLSSCNETGAPLASSLSVDNSDIEFEAQNPSVQTVNVTSDGDWIVVAPSWLTVTPRSGSGNAEVSVVPSDNLDSDNTVSARRYATLSFQGSGVEANVTVLQNGDASKEVTYKKASAVTSENTYLIVSGTSVAVPLTSAYGYLPMSEVFIVEGQNDEPASIVMHKDDSYGFVFTSATVGEGGSAVSGYTVQATSDSRYIYQTGDYDTFNAGAVSDNNFTASYIWTVTPEDDGTFAIENAGVGKTILYVPGDYSFGSFADVESGNLPELYELQTGESSSVQQ